MNNCFRHVAVLYILKIKLSKNALHAFLDFFKNINEVIKINHNLLNKFFCDFYFLIDWF